MLETHLLSSSLRALVFALSCAIGVAQAPCSVGSPNIHEGQFQFLPSTTVDVDVDVTLVWWTMGSCPCDPCEIDLGIGAHYLLAGLTAMCWSCAD